MTWLVQTSWPERSTTGKKEQGCFIVDASRRSPSHPSYPPGRKPLLPSGKERNALFRTVQRIHQDPYAALNPARTLGQSLYDPLKLQASKLGKKQARRRC